MKIFCLMGFHKYYVDWNTFKYNENKQAEVTMYCDRCGHRKVEV